MILEKFQRGRGGGSFSIQKIMLKILGTSNKAFWAWNWYKRANSGFRVCFINNCIEKNQNKTRFEEDMCMHFILSGLHTSLHICNHIHHKKFATWFSKNEWGESKAVWNLSKNSSLLVAEPFPNRNYNVKLKLLTKSSHKVAQQKQKIFWNKWTKQHNFVK